MKHQFIKTFLYSSGLLTVTNIIVGGLNYLFNVLVGRALGPEHFGEVAAFISYFIFFSIPGSVLTNIIIQRIGSNHDNPYAYARAVEQWLLQHARTYSWYIVPLGCIAIPFMPQLTNIVPLGAYLIIPIGIISIFVALYSGFLQGLSLIFYYCIVLLITTVIKLMGAVLVHINVISLSSIFITLAFSSLVGLILVVSMSRYFITKRIEATPFRIGKSLMQVFQSRSLWVMSLSLVGMIALNAIDIMLAKRLLDATQAGIYSAWSLIAKIPLYFMSPILMASYIMFTKKNNQAPRYIHAGFLLVLIIFAISMVTIYHMLREFIPVIIFGEEYVQLYLYMEYAALFGSLLMVIAYCNNYLLAQARSTVIMLPIGVIIYIVVFLIMVKSIMDIMIINTLFMSVLALLYVIAYVIAVRDQYAKA